MSKMDNLRAMREARYEAAQAAARARAKAGGATATKTTVAADAPPGVTPEPAAKVAKPTTRKAATKRSDSRSAATASAAAVTATATEELCGHRNMSGRTCTREKGHFAKSHRYS